MFNRFEPPKLGNFLALTETDAMRMFHSKNNNTAEPMSVLRVGIVGCGLIGERRAKNLKNAQLVFCADVDIAKAEALSKKYPYCQVTSKWQDLVGSPEVDIVIVAVTHADLAEISLAAVKAKKHVLVEKPAARRAAELHTLKQWAYENQCCVHVGYNHRYHRAFRQAMALVQEGAIGELMFIRARYGHGGRIGYDKEWRAHPELSGGGELIDQGVHLIDLARWFLGDFSDIQGFADTYYWDMPVDDNSFLLLRTAKKQTAFLHASCTEWKNTFSFEIYGKLGKLEITGLGGSYGVERLALYKMLPEMGPPETTIWEYPMEDDSWAVEWLEFIEDIQQKRSSNLGIDDGIAALNVVETIYKMT